MRPLVVPTGSGDGGGHRPSPSAVARLKAVVRQSLLLADDTPVVIHEAACTEDGCAPVETIIAVIDGSERTYRLPHPIADVAPEAVRALILEGSHDDHHA